MRKYWFIVLALMLIMSVGAVAHAEEIATDLPNEFLTWDVLGSYAGSVLAVVLITQLTKELPHIAKIPTQIWSYVLAVVILIASHAFNGSLTFSNAALSLVNSVMVSLAANGGYSMITRIKNK